MKKAFLLFSLFSYSIFAKPKETDITIETLHLFKYPEAIEYIANLIPHTDELTSLFGYNKLPEEDGEPFIDFFDKSIQSSLNILLNELVHVLKEDRDNLASVSKFLKIDFNNIIALETLTEENQERVIYLEKIQTLIERLEISVKVKSTSTSTSTSKKSKIKITLNQLVNIDFLIKLLINQIDELKNNIIVENIEPSE